jgi:uncharacterized protein YegJ (DUF2314 family)
MRFLPVVLLLASCDRGAPPPVVSFKEDDAAMNAAIQKARGSVQEFIAAFQNPKPTQTDFSIKAKFTDGIHSEHMWVTELRFDGKAFSGKIGNDPAKLKNVRFGSPCTIAPNEISDWMFVDADRLVGGATIRVMRNQLSPAERKEFDQTFPFRIEDY